MSAFLETPIEFAKGVGTARAEAFRSELKVRTFEDLLYYFPFRYVDKSKFHRVSEVVSDAVDVQLKGRVVGIQELGQQHQKRLVATFEDDSGQIELVWFKGGKWIKPLLQSEGELIIFGRPNRFKGRLSMPHPEVEKLDSVRLNLGAALKPVYGTTEKLTSRKLNSNGIDKVAKEIVAEMSGKVTEYLPLSILKSLGLPSRENALREAHAPTSMQNLELARKRLKLEELLLLQLVLIRNKLVQTRKLKGVVMPLVGDLFNQFYNEQLPFELTGAQKRVIKEIRTDMRHGYHMNRLLQGDVGSGKTIVAVLIALLAIDNGFQVCLMAPTEILANQHFQTFKKLLEQLPVEVVLMTGSTKKSERKPIHEGLQQGSVNIIIGTHALIEPDVKFSNLGLVIIDEQHRFGVKQRAMLWGKAALPPHILVMTATPIPRTLAMTMYGDLDVSTIDELPPGRTPVLTSHRTDAARLRVFAFIESEIKKGRQIYIVYPLIQESETLDYKDLMDGFESVRRRFPLPEYKISIVHGQMKAEEKNWEMEQFVKGKTNILVSTTVIEVGVDVPNASVMVIESTERFGLSQLHQLRGRVGRGAEKSYCVLMTGHKLSQDAKTRIETMVRTNDGFEVAEVDLQLRGPGDIMGTQQSGLLDLKIADLARDQEVLKAARYLAEKILTEDPEFDQPENQALGKKLQSEIKKRLNWGLIS
jgi:ATP-dependent DNA helicase RecG